MDGRAAPWTAADCSALLEGVRQSLLEAPQSIPWDFVHEQVRDTLPGRTLDACKRNFYQSRIAGIVAAPLAEEAGEPEAGGHGKEWTQAENAALAAAVQAGLDCAEQRCVNWVYVESNARDLAGRSRGSLQAYWRSTLSKTAAAKKMLQEVSEELAAKVRQRRLHRMVEQQQQQQQTPFHMLYSLLSSGAIDAETFSACWRATAEAMR